MQTYEYCVDGPYFVRYGLVEAEDIRAAYAKAQEQLKGTEVLRGVTELTADEARRAREVEPVA